VRAPVRLAFVGDINLGTMTLPGGVPPDSGRGLLQGAKPFLTGDLVIGNFEGVLADSGETVKCGKKRSVAWATSPAAMKPPTATTAPVAAKRAAANRTRHKAKPEPVRCYAFLTPAFLAPRLSEAGFTHLNLANNHANDFGLDGRRSTDSILASLGLGTYGPLGSVVIDTVRRGDASTTVGIVGFTTYPFAYDLLDIPRSVAVVDSIRKLVDLLVVTFHGGAEGSDALHLPFAAESLGHEQRGELRAWAHAVVEAGADLVVGHGPHVLRGIEMWQGRLIAYSLGNFVTYRGFNLAGPLALTGVLDVEFAKNGRLASARLHPMRQLPLQGPAGDPEQSASRLVRVLSTDDFGGSAAQVDNDGTIGPP
jgi:Bacterial capsule synthesis protein PGA_cap